MLNHYNKNVTVNYVVQELFKIFLTMTQLMTLKII